MADLRYTTDIRHVLATEATICAMLSSGWTALFLFFKHVICRSRSSDFSNRLVSLLHVLVGLVWPLFVIDLRRLKAEVGSPTSPEQLILLRVSFAYFFYDMLCCLAIKLDIADAFHHVATLAGLYIGIVHRVSGHELLICLALMEASNPFMHLRFMLRELGKAKSQFASRNDLMFAGSFILCRGILGPVIVFWTIMSPRTPLVVKMGGLAIQLVSLFWMEKIFSALRRKYLPKRQ